MAIRIGILGASNIAGKVIASGALEGENYSVSAVASRTLAKAEAFAGKYGVPTAFASYEDMLASADVDAVYITLPNHLHVEASMHALEAGKHVLLEKPAAPTTDELQNLIGASSKHTKLKVMEAFMYRFHPQWSAIKGLITAGSIGKLRAVDTHFSYMNRDAGNIRNAYPLSAGGGVLFDIGCYGISVARLLYGEEAKSVTASLELDETGTVDVLTSAVMKFPSGLATFTCSSRAERYQHVRIVGEEGVIEVPWPFNPEAGKPANFSITDARGTEQISVPASNQYKLQFEGFAEAILTDKPVAVSLDDSLANLKTIEAIIDSAT